MCVYLHQMYGTVSCWACTDRAYVCIGVSSVEFEVVIVWCLTQYVYGGNLSHPHVLSKYITIMVMADDIYLRRMYGTVSCWSATNSVYVRIDVLEFECVIGVRHHRMKS